MRKIASFSLKFCYLNTYNLFKAGARMLRATKVSEEERESGQAQEKVRGQE